MGVPTARADRLVELMREEELDCLLVTGMLNVRYLTGFTGSNAACVLTADERLFLTDFRYVSQAREQVRDFERLAPGEEMLADVAERLGGRTGFDHQQMTVATRAKLVEKAGDGVELVDAGGLVEGLREVKDAGELELMRAAAVLATEAFERTLEGGLVGRTELEVARALARTLEDMGAQAPSFEAIVAAGAHGALPHAEPRDVPIPAGTLVVIDWGARLQGYCSDCTRTVATGPLEDAAAEVYELVLAAQEKALAAVRAGADRRGLDALARAVIEDAGHGEHFGHGLGHGVGLEVHERPRLSKLAEGELLQGSVVTVEPGVYLPGDCGVRIEDLVVVGADGAEVLTSFSKALTTVG